MLETPFSPSTLVMFLVRVEYFVLNVSLKNAGGENDVGGKGWNGIKRTSKTLSSLDDEVDALVWPVIAAVAGAAGVLVGVDDGGH